MALEKPRNDGHSLGDTTAMRVRLVNQPPPTNGYQQLPIHESTYAGPVVKTEWSIAEKLCLYVPPSLVVFLALVATQLGVYLFAELYEWQTLWILLANYMQVQICTNVWAVWTGRKKNCPQYQLHRLGMSAAWLAQYKNEYAEYESVHKRFWKWKWCRKCERSAPLRSVHCNDCGQCSLRNDHHCYVMGVCIGVANTGYFILYTLWMAVFGTWGTGTFLYFAYQLIFNSSGEVGRRYVDPLYASLRRIGEPGAQKTLDASFVLLNPQILTILGATLVGGFSMLALITGLVFLVTQMHCIYKGMGFREEDSLDPLIRGDQPGTTFWTRLRFLVGKPVWLRVLVPPPLLWLFSPRTAEVEWDESHVRSIITQPFKGVVQLVQAVNYDGMA